MLFPPAGLSETLPHSGGLHQSNFVMRFISFSILFAVFAILFHGVASADAPAQNAQNDPFQDPKVADSLRRSHHSRLRAKVGSSFEDCEGHSRDAEYFRMETIGRLRHNTDREQRAAFHRGKVDGYRRKLNLAQEIQKNVKNRMTKQKWKRDANKHADYMEMREKLALEGR